MPSKERSHQTQLSEWPAARAFEPRLKKITNEIGKLLFYHFFKLMFEEYPQLDFKMELKEFDKMLVFLNN